MITAGIDLASRDAGTACCEIEWSEGRARVHSLELGTADARILEVIRTVDKVGIDVPLGWPVSFVEAVTQHSKDGSWPVDYLHSDTRAVRYRRTDLALWKTMGGAPPLSVSTDRIALPAMRAASLLARLRPPVAIDGSGAVVESYPAASLRRWGLASRGYKRRENLAQLEALVSEFVRRTRSWLALSSATLSLCRASDDAFDAVICALVARASAIALCEPIGEEDRALARREGWIALPLEGSLDRLVTEPAHAP